MFRDGLLADTSSGFLPLTVDLPALPPLFVFLPLEFPVRP